MQVDPTSAQRSEMEPLIEPVDDGLAARRMILRRRGDARRVRGRVATGSTWTLGVANLARAYTSKATATVFASNPTFMPPRRFGFGFDQSGRPDLNRG
jgi:hypothetical protein